MTWVLIIAGAVAAWIWIHVSRSSRKRGSAQGAARREEIFSDQVAPGITFSAYMVRPDPAVWEREREEQKRARQAAIDRLRAGFPRPTAFADAIAGVRLSIGRLAQAHSCPPPDFDRVLADARAGGPPAKTEQALRKHLNQSYKLRSDPAQLAEALACALLHLELLATHGDPNWKVVTSVKRLANNLDHGDQRRACIGFFMLLGEAVRSARPDVTLLCDEQIGHLFSHWHSDDEATARFHDNLARVAETTSASDKHFVINGLVEYLDRRRRFDPSMQTQLVALCEQDVALYKTFLAQFTQLDGKWISFARAVQSKDYLCPRLPSLDTLWDIYEEERDVGKLRRLQKIAKEIRYGSYEDDSEIDDAIGGAEPPELDAPVESAATVPTEVIEVRRSGHKGKSVFLDRRGQPCGTEEAALDYLAGQGFNTLRGEVRFWQAMFGLVFWEEIFDGTGTPNAMNDIPHDLFSGESFYEVRKARIDQKAALVAKSNVAPFVSAQLRRYGDTWTRIVFDGRDFSYRDVLNGAQVSQFLSTIQPPVFAKIVHRIASNPTENRAGLPDYVAWKDRTVVFVEVKGIREKIRDTQEAWLHWMVAEGIPVKVLRVRGVAEPGIAAPSGTSNIDASEEEDRG
jgi:hypothetical protein